MEMCQLKNIRLQEMNQRVNDCMATWHEQKTKILLLLGAIK